MGGTSGQKHNRVGNLNALLNEHHKLDVAWAMCVCLDFCAILFHSYVHYLWLGCYHCYSPNRSSLNTSPNWQIRLNTFIFFFLK